MQEHSYSFDIDGTPKQIWAVLHGRPPVRPGGPTGEPTMGEFGPIVRTIEYGGVKIEILHEGDEHGSGLVRHCYYRVPKYLLSGGIAESWEHVTSVVPEVSAHYYAVGRPPWSRADGEHRLEPITDTRTRVHFAERYEIRNPLARAVFEARVHRFISKDNDTLVRQGIEGGLKYQQRGG